MATSLKPAAVQGTIVPTPATRTQDYTPGTYLHNKNVLGMSATDARKAVGTSDNKGYETVTLELPETKPTGLRTSSAIIDENGLKITGGSAKYTDKYGNTTYGDEAIGNIKSYSSGSSGSRSSNNINISGANSNSMTPKIETPKVNVGSVNTDNAKVLDKTTDDMSGGINKDDKKYKEGTYFYYTKQLGQTPEQARASVKQFSAKSPVVTPKTTEVSTFTSENIYDKGEATQKDITEEGKTLIGDIKKLKTESALEKKTKELGVYSENETRITNERDTAIGELETLMGQYEKNRLNQVRGGIMQALAQSGRDLNSFSPEMLIQLSGEVGSRAFTDIYQQKESAKSKIQALRASAVNSLNEIAAKRGMSEIEYKNALNDIDATEKQDIYNLDTAFSNFVLGAGEKKVNQDTANKTAATNALYTILTNANIPLDQQNAFANLISKPGATAESVLKDLQTNLSPAQKKIIEDARKAASEAANAKYATQLQIQQMKNDTAKEIASAKLASATRKAASSTGSSQKALTTAISNAQKLFSMGEFTAAQDMLTSAGVQ